MIISPTFICVLLPFVLKNERPTLLIHVEVPANPCMQATRDVVYRYRLSEF